MRTPAGKECQFFYGDYYRGKNHEECRLLSDARLAWEPRLCETCPLPEIRMANSCEHLDFSPELRKAFLIGRPQVAIHTSCAKSGRTVSEPRIGCGECHPALSHFVIGSDDPNTPD